MNRRSFASDDHIEQCLDDAASITSDSASDSIRTAIRYYAGLLRIVDGAKGEPVCIALRAELDEYGGVCISDVRAEIAV